MKSNLQNFVKNWPFMSSGEVVAVQVCDYSKIFCANQKRKEKLGKWKDVNDYN